MRNWVILSSQNLVKEERVFVWVWDSFHSSCVLNCTTVLDTFWTREIISDMKCCNKECCLFPACFSFLLMINHSSVLNYSGLPLSISYWSYCVQIHKSSAGDSSSKGQDRDPLQKDRMVRIGWFLCRAQLLCSKSTIKQSRLLTDTVSLQGWTVHNFSAPSVPVFNH